MELNLSARFLCLGPHTKKPFVLCFSHAAKHAVQYRSHDVAMEIDDFASERDGRTTQCIECSNAVRYVP